MAKPSSENSSATAEALLFRSLIYTDNTFLNRLRCFCSSSGDEEFYVLQAVQKVTALHRNNHLEILEKHSTDIDVILSLNARFAADINEISGLRRSRARESSESEEKVDESLVGDDYVFHCQHFNKRVCDEEEAENNILQAAFVAHAQRYELSYKTFAPGLDQKFYECFLYREYTDKDMVTGTYCKSEREFETGGELYECNEPISVSQVLVYVNRLRAECLYKLSQAGTAADDTLPYAPYFLSKLHDSEETPFHKAVVALWMKVSAQSIIFNIQIWQLEGRDLDYIGSRITSHLNDLMDDILHWPWDYSKWVTVLVSKESYKALDSQGKGAYDSLCNYLQQVMSYASVNGLSTAVDLCIDLMFSLSLRHPNPCDTLERCINYVRTVLIPTLPSASPEFGTPIVEDDELWMPHFASYFKSLLDLEYLSLHNPFFMHTYTEVREEKYNRYFSSSIPTVGTYILRVDIVVEELWMAGYINKPSSTLPVLHICFIPPAQCCSTEKDVAFVFYGNHMMVMDSGVTLLNVSGLKFFSLEFLIDNSDLMLYMNGKRLYDLNLSDIWNMQNGGIGDIGFSIALDDSAVHLTMPGYLSPGFRIEVIRRRVVTSCSITSSPSKEASLHNSVYSRHLYLWKLTSCIHMMTSRIVHNLEKYPVTPIIWGPDLVRYIRLLFDLVLCNLDCAEIVFTYFNSYESVNALTLWRLIGDSILSILSSLNLLMSIPTKPFRIPTDMLELLGSCVAGCLRFRPLIVRSQHMEQHHLQLDLNCLADAINVKSVSLLTCCPIIWSQVFSSTKLSLLKDILVYLVSLEPLAFSHTFVRKYVLHALKILNRGDCLAIFTKRGFSQAVASYPYSVNGEMAGMENDWWMTIVSILEVEKTMLCNLKEFEDDECSAYCTCDSNYGNCGASPFLMCCSCCVHHRCVEASRQWEDRLTVNEVQESNGCPYPKPCMLLCRLLVKQGALFLCLNASASHRDADVVSQSMMNEFLLYNSTKHIDRFGDWKNKIIYSRDDLLDVANSRKCLRIFTGDDIVKLEHILARLLNYYDVVVNVASNNISGASSEVLCRLSSGVQSFLSAVSIVDVLAYFVELLHYISSTEGNCSVIYQSYVTCVNLIPSIMKVIIAIYNCISGSESIVIEANTLIKGITLQYHCIVQLLGKILLFLARCKGNVRKHKDYELRLDLEVDVTALMKSEGSNDSLFPLCLLRGAWMELCGECKLYGSLNRLSSLLQDFMYHKGSVTFTNEVDQRVPEKCEGTLWAMGILEEDPSAIELLMEKYTCAHPSLNRCQLAITSVFIHLLDCNTHNVEVAVRYGSQIVLQLLRQLQGKHTFSTEAEQQDLRKRRMENIVSRCRWLIDNIRGAIYYSRCEGQCSLEGCISLKNQSQSSSPGVYRSCTYTKSKEESVNDDIGLSKGPFCRKAAYRRSRSLDGSDTVVITRNPAFKPQRVDIRLHISEITGFLLYGPNVIECESYLYAERISSMSLYTIWRCINILVAMFSDIIFVGGEEVEDPYVMQPLMLGLLYSREGGCHVTSEVMGETIRLLWYNIVTVSRLLVLHVADDQVLTAENPSLHGHTNVFGYTVMTAQSVVLEKMCDWYLRSGISSMENATFCSGRVDSWMRVSLPFLGLLFSLGVDPISNSRYASQIFRNIFTALQPIRMGQSGFADMGHLSVNGYGSVILLFISLQFIRGHHVNAHSLFKSLTTQGYSRKDFKKAPYGEFHLWVKKDSTLRSDSRVGDVNFRLLWSTNRINGRIRNAEIEAFNQTIARAMGSCITSHNGMMSDKSDVTVWHIPPTECCDVINLSFTQLYQASIMTTVECSGCEASVFIALRRPSYTPGLGENYLGYLHHLGGKLELAKGNGIWTSFQGYDASKSIYPMRRQLHYLMHFMLWTYFSSNLYSPKDNMSSIEISSALCRMLMENLREAAKILRFLEKSCECKRKVLSDDGKTSFRYIASQFEDEKAPVTLEGILTRMCEECTGNMFCLCEVENFWISILAVLIRQVDSTKHYSLVYHILNCLLTTFTLGEDELDTLLSNVNIGPAFCELFIVAMRRLSQQHLGVSECLVSTVEYDAKPVTYPELHGMFLYRWLPPLQRSPLECILSSVRDVFHSVIHRGNYHNIRPMVQDNGSDPFANLPRSDNFTTHRPSADFEAEINGTTLHITRAVNMGGISLFRIPLSIGSAAYTRGTVSFFILSPGRFGITVAPADCIFGSVVDLFERNDVVGFMTAQCPPFVHDVFAATINYRVGDVLSASFTVEEQEDRQICLRTELLIAGNSIGSVLEVVYDPATQNDPMRRMSMVFIFQDPQTLVYNGLNDVAPNTSNRLVSRETQSTFRSDTASEHLVEVPITPEDSNASLGMEDRRTSIAAPSGATTAVRTLDEGVVTEEEGDIFSTDDIVVSDLEQDDSEMIALEYLPSIDKFITTDWDTSYDVMDPEEDVTNLGDIESMCKDEMWQTFITSRGEQTSSNYAIMFAESIQLYQAILMNNMKSLDGLKEEVVGQMCLSFESLYYKLASCPGGIGVDEEALRDCFSWLCVLACDVDVTCWRRSGYSANAKLETVSDFRLPWLMGCSSTSRSCASKLSVECCRRLLISLSHLLSLPSLSSILCYTFNKRSCSDFLSLEDLAAASSILALAARCLVASVIIGRVLCEKGFVFDVSDKMSFEYICVDNLVGVVYMFIRSADREGLPVRSEGLLNVLHRLGITVTDRVDAEMIGFSSGTLGKEEMTSESRKHINCVNSSRGEISTENMWQMIFEAVDADILVDKPVRSLNGMKVQDLPPNPKMFATCDYTYHCGYRLPSERRNIIRRTLGFDVCQHEMYELTSVLLFLAPHYFLGSILEVNPHKAFYIFRSSILHFVRGYDFDCADYWSWAYVGGSVSVKSMDLYSKTVDPLYGWQRLFYMEDDVAILKKMLDAMLTELLYCVSMIMTDYKRCFGLSHVVHWILDSFIRHPLSNGIIRKRFVNSYVWGTLHTLLINCSALPCKLAVVASRLTSWLIPVSSRSQLRKMFLATHYCGQSALHRVTSLCNFYNIFDLDTFTNLDLKRQDHATKVASAMLVHVFASVLFLLMEQRCCTSMKTDEVLDIANYMLISGGTSTYSEIYINGVLSLSQNLMLEAGVPLFYMEKGGSGQALMTKPFIAASNIRKLQFTFHVKEASRIVLSLDRKCLDMVGETLFFPDVIVKAKSWEPVLIDFQWRAPFDFIRRNGCLPDLQISREVTDHFRDTTFRVGFLARGVDNLSSPSSRVHFEDNLVYLEVSSELEIQQRVNEKEIVWSYGLTTVHLALPVSVELLSPFISVIHPSCSSYMESVRIRRNSLMLPLNSLSFYVHKAYKPRLIPRQEGLVLNFPLRSGVSLCPDDEEANTDNAMVLDISAGCDIVDMKEKVCDKGMSTHAALPFTVAVLVEACHEDFYIGLTWCGLRFLWFSSGEVECPKEPPIFKYGMQTKSHISLLGVGFSAGDVVGLRFIPERRTLLFLKNGSACMMLDFVRFYRPHAIDTLTASTDIAGPDIILVKEALFTAIESDNIYSTKRIISFLFNSPSPESMCKAVLEAPILEGLEITADNEKYEHCNAIYLCCILNRLDLLKCISAAPVNYDSYSGLRKETPLMAAAKRGHNMMLSYMLSMLNVDVNAQDSLGMTALMHALSDMDRADVEGYGSSILSTVKLLVTFGADVTIVNNAGCTVLDMLPLQSRSKRDICNYLTTVYKFVRCSKLEWKGIHRRWPGLLGGSEFICGIRGDHENQPSVSLNRVKVDNEDFMAVHFEPSHELVYSDDIALQRNAMVGYIELSLENMRQAVELLISKLPEQDLSQAEFLTRNVNFSETRIHIAKQLSIFLRGLVKDVMSHGKWTSWRVLCTFVRIVLDYCNRLDCMNNENEAMISFLKFEQYVMRLHLLHRRDSLPPMILNRYRDLLHDSNLFHCEYSMQSNEFLAMSYLSPVSMSMESLYGGRLRTAEFTECNIPAYCTDEIKLTLKTNQYAFHRIRYHLNRDVTKELDFAIHCIADLISNSHSAKQLISTMILRCNTREDIQGYLPPLGCNLWNGIYTTVDSLLECFSKLRFIVKSNLDCERFDELEEQWLLNHLITTIDDASLREYMDSLPREHNTRQKLKELIEKLQLVDEDDEDRELDMRIAKVSLIDRGILSSRLSDSASPRVEWSDYLYSAFCYVLVNDRLYMLDQLNDTFKMLVPIIGTVLNKPVVEYLPLSYQVMRPYKQFVEAPHCLAAEEILMTKASHISGKGACSREEMGVCIGPSEIPVHWSVYFGNRSLIRRSLINDMYRKIFISLQTMNRERPYFSIRVDRGISATATSLKHTLWYQSCQQFLACNPNILRARNNQRPFMVVFKGEGATDFGGPFQEFLSSVSNEVMHPLGIETRLTKSGQMACTKCSNTINSYGPHQDTVMLKSGISNMHPMIKLIESDMPQQSKIMLRCGDTGLSCSSGCCNIFSSTRCMDDEADVAGNRSNCKCGGVESMEDHCSQGVPMVLNLYESLGRLFAMCVCMMNPLSVAMNPIIWKKLLAANLSLKDLADYDKMSSDLLQKLQYSQDRYSLLDGLTFSLESTDGRVVELLSDGCNVNVTRDNIDLFTSIATLFRLTQADASTTWLARGFNAVLPIGRFGMLLDYKLLEFMVCGDPRIDLEVLRAHTVSTSVTLKRDLFDVLATFDNAKLQMFLRFVSGRSRLPPTQSEWSLQVEYDISKEREDDGDSRLPTSSTCSFRLLIPRYSSKQIMKERLLYAIKHCMAIDLDAYQVHETMELNQ
ncbi:hypothetical protein BgAZ_200090 [Babesia gibsoni]|uniref:HECT domain-containing protein n=1 Tax=Babesia gibsoni TaxID=33632 RepID=A0AAD8PD93_BABGI|nr:hypothetical protein BgAZ_200090 [Babesia gibsoni]